MLTIFKVETDWCSLCRVYQRTFNKYIEDNGLKAVYVDADQEPDFVAKYDVTVYPTTLVFRDDEMISSRPGVLRYHELKELVESVSME